ncbi:hypothetical protein L198_04274 [Cryptococcus wingfieldii CBS 7118]|uniref:GID complex catalytic subunit 2 n=1 Tax=Cryptococcus wingfieldii CBS 7118 TaxID=1295528 RepID=A0A1E3J6R3_9TREE|nr:hypothetical protein L198_04274 [Cryptococcus wingfieldii CBS 7118]ODN96559.1 hypothetical protein L198_04274 [Cryptococcus wingfieldii CBS 7118]
MDIVAALDTLESLSSSTSTSSSGPLHALIDTHFAQAKERILSGDDPKTVVVDLQKLVQKSKKEVDKGLKGWYGALGNVGKAVDKTFPPTLGVISKAYESPNLFVDEEASVALDKAVLDSLGRRGLWDAVAALEKETSLKFPEEQRALASQLQFLTASILSSNLTPALEWCATNQQFLASPPHPSSLPYYLHRAVFQSIADKKEAIIYARQHMMEYLPTKPVMKMITSRLYDQFPRRSEDIEMADSKGETKVTNPLSDEDATDLAALVSSFRLEFHRLHQWPKEDPLSVAVDLGSTGGALMVIEKARRVMGEHLGHVRQWTDLPMEVPLSASRRYHSVFVCPVSKEQATESNPPKMMTCGHVVASESFDRLLKGGRRDVKCPYCPIETAQSAAQRLYF